MSKYDEDHISKLIKALSEGKGRVNATKFADIGYQTFLDWMRDKREFSERVKRAERKGSQRVKEYAEAAVVKAMNDHWQAGAWYLERCHPNQYAKVNERAYGEHMEQGGQRLQEIARAVMGCDGTPDTEQVLSRLSAQIPSGGGGAKGEEDTDRDKESTDTSVDITE